MINLRKATLQDLLPIKEIDTSLFSEDSYPLFALRQLLDISNGLVKVVEVDGKLAGYTIGHYNSEKAEGWVLSLGVLPAYQGQQLGLKLSATVIAELERKGAKNTYLTVYPDNQAALALYHKLGFTRYATSDNYYQDNSPRLVMQKTAAS